MPHPMCFALVLISLFYFVQICYCGVPITDFYPFGQSEGDTVKTVDFVLSEEMNLNVAFPFYGNGPQSKLLINPNGYLAFGKGAPFIGTFCVASSEMLIAVFMTDLFINPPGTLNFRQSNDPALLNRANTEISDAFPDVGILGLSNLVIITWNKLQCPGDPVISYTFQAILATDGVNSFTIINFNEIPDDGCVSTLPAGVGFEKGDPNPTKAFYVPTSCTPNIVSVDNSTNVGIQGKFIFQVNNDPIREPTKILSTTTTTKPTTTTTKPTTTTTEEPMTTTKQQTTTTEKSATTYLCFDYSELIILIIFLFAGWISTVVIIKTKLTTSNKQPITAEQPETTEQPEITEQPTTTEQPATTDQSKTEQLTTKL